MKNSNMVFLYIFDWFIDKYGKTTPKDRSKLIGNEWLPSGIPSKALSPLQCASSLAHPIQARGDTLYVIKRCGIYAKEFKNWIAWENKSPPIAEKIDSFKEYWSNPITRVNKTAAPAL